MTDLSQNVRPPGPPARPLVSPCKGMSDLQGKFSVYQDKEQWVPLFNWFWIRPGETGVGHGPFPARWIARLSGWWHNR